MIVLKHNKFLSDVNEIFVRYYNSLSRWEKIKWRIWCFFSDIHKAEIKELTKAKKQIEYELSQYKYKLEAINNISKI